MTRPRTRRLVRTLLCGGFLGLVCMGFIVRWRVHESFAPAVDGSENDNHQPMTSLHRERHVSKDDNLQQSIPSLRSIVQGWNITGDASWLLQFSIVGFPKSGTSTLMWHLRDHPEIRMFADERCELGANQHARLIRDMYRLSVPSSPLPTLPVVTTASHTTTTSTAVHLPPPPLGLVRGIKCPSDLENTKLALRNYRSVFPQTDFIAGVRHPVLWYVVGRRGCLLRSDCRFAASPSHGGAAHAHACRFESFYNFRVHNRFPMPPAETLIGKCKKGWNFVCTYRSNFHIFLSNLGKTNMSTDPREQQLVDEAYRKSIRDPVPTPRRIFLYEVSQLSDPDDKRAEQFRRDLQQYLQLQRPIDPFIWYKPGRKHSSENEQKAIDAQKIDICQERFDALRSVLMHHSIQASTWMRQYFIHAEGVVVSSKSYFANTILKAWEQDPCDERRLSRPAHDR
jgi:hypothetical protein